MSHEGYHKFYDPELDVLHGSFEIFKAHYPFEVFGPNYPNSYERSSFEPNKYYWWSCFPGCLPDSGANGPFETSHEAYENAQDF